MSLIAQEIQDKLKDFQEEDSCDLCDIEAIVKLVEQLPKNITILETGSFKGKCACAWALATEGTVYTIEISDYRDIIEKNIKSVGLEDRVFPIHADSKYLTWNRTVDVVWLDSRHFADTLPAEIDKFLPYAKLLICGHDYGHSMWPDVKTIVDSKFKNVVTILTRNNSYVWYKWIDREENK